MPDLRPGDRVLKGADTAFQAGDFRFNEVLHIGETGIHTVKSLVHGVPQIIDAPVLKVKPDHIAENNHNGRSPVGKLIHRLILFLSVILC
jgi:hypothetical protein